VSGEAAAALERAYREEWGRIVAALIGYTGEWDLSEESAAEAFARASERWPLEGVPERPGAWLTTVARHRALDRLRRADVESNKLASLATLDTMDDAHAFDVMEIGDDRLRLIFTCCHPALSLEARVALTLRTLCGLSTAEIARAFLVAEPAMAKRITRAKAKIRDAAIPYRVPPAEQLPDRLSGVLVAVYLVFNEGYAATSGTGLTRSLLAEEALRLGELLVGLMPDEPEAMGLLALMWLQDSRRIARIGADGGLVTLENQDRSQWDRDEIDRAFALIDAAARRGPPGPYQLQAAIAACHASRLRAGDRLGRDRAALRVAVRAPPDLRGRAQPRGRHRDGPRPARGPGAHRARGTRRRARRLPPAARDEGGPPSPRGGP
jgi:RNA polymerase sigma-70 factor (ECF subfamily)